jgi:hypothetical protein
VHSQIDPRAVERLNRIVDATGARIVISSSWRHAFSRDEISAMLRDRGFRHPDSVIDVTPSLLAQRGEEVAKWLGGLDESRRLGGEGSDGYVILDDSTDFDSQELRDHMVLTDPEVGLTDSDVQRAIQILGM